jgi:hypothetical protein
MVVGPVRLRPSQLAGQGKARHGMAGLGGAWRDKEID